MRVPWGSAQAQPMHLACRFARIMFFDALRLTHPLRELRYHRVARCIERERKGDFGAQVMTRSYRRGCLFDHGARPGDALRWRWFGLQRAGIARHLRPESGLIRCRRCRRVIGRYLADGNVSVKHCGRELVVAGVRSITCDRCRAVTHPLDRSSVDLVK